MADPVDITAPSLPPVATTEPTLPPVKETVAALEPVVATPTLELDDVARSVAEAATQQMERRPPSGSAAAVKKRDVVDFPVEGPRRRPPAPDFPTARPVDLASDDAVLRRAAPPRRRLASDGFEGASLPQLPPAEAKVESGPRSFTSGMVLLAAGALLLALALLWLLS